MDNRDLQSEATAVGKKNLLAKLSFVVGDGTAATLEFLGKQLQNYLESTGENPVTRQAIYAWTQNKSVPSRKNAFLFLRGFLEEAVPYGPLTPDQKKVFNQVLDFLKKTAESIQDSTPEAPHNPTISTGKSRVIAIDSFPNQTAFDQCARSWSGVYLTFRMSLILPEPTISREVVRIRKVRNYLQYQHWYRHDGVDVERYEGAVANLGEAIWMFGSSLDGSRYRFCHFRQNPSISPSARRFRWGLMHADVPVHPSYDPASTRILMILIEPPNTDFATLLDRAVQYLAPGDVPPDLQSVISRSISNQVSASSKSGSIEPDEQIDNFLRVSQGTLEQFSTIAPDLADLAWP